MDYLYHYTNIDSLALILSTKRLRFSALKTVDDVRESKIKGLESLQNNLFVSCWTDLEEESIPFWKMYTKDMSGVRIKMQAHPFGRYDSPKGYYYTSNLTGTSSIFPNEESFTDSYWIMPTIKNFLTKVEYLDEASVDSFEDVIRDSSGAFSVDFQGLGTRKTKHWEFQSEWRYRIVVCPTKGATIEKTPIRMMLSGYDMPIDAVFAPLSDYALQNIEILLGPKHTKADRIIVESLAEKYSPTAVIKESYLYGLIR